MSDEKQLWVAAVSFTRTQPKTKQEQEWGLYLGRHEGDDKARIFDMNGEEVKEIWDYRLWPYRGCLVLREHE